MAGLSGNEYADLRGRMSDYIDHVDSKRDSAKAAAVAYPSSARTVLAEADAYGDVAEDLREMFSHWPK